MPTARRSRRWPLTRRAALPLTRQAALPLLNAHAFLVCQGLPLLNAYAFASSQGWPVSRIQQSRIEGWGCIRHSITMQSATVCTSAGSLALVILRAARMRPSGGMKTPRQAERSVSQYTTSGYRSKPTGVPATAIGRAGSARLEPASDASPDAFYPPNPGSAGFV